MHEVARGRIWSGPRAHEVGLVDEIDGLLGAIDRAQLLAGLDPADDVSIIALPPRSPLGAISFLLGSVSTDVTFEELATVATLVDALGLDDLLRVTMLYGDGQPAARLPYNFSGDL